MRRRLQKIFWVHRLSILLTIMVLVLYSTFIVAQKVESQEHQNFVENDLSTTKQKGQVEVVSTEKIGEPKDITTEQGNTVADADIIKPKDNKVEMESSDDSDEENASDFYFYLYDQESDVVEVEPSVNFGDQDEPSFLFNPKPGQIRVVEFYAHWCPHCRAFRPKYNKFAARMKEIAKQINLDIGVYAISCVPHKPVCRKHDIHGYPKVKLFLPGEMEGEIIEHGSLHPYEILKRIGSDPSFAAQLGTIDEEDISDASNGIESLLAKGSDSSFWIPKTKADIYNDAHLSFDFAMRHSIFVGKDPLSEVAKEALSDWLEMLQEVLPPTWQLQSMISEIFERAEAALVTEAILLEIVDKYPPPKKTWSQSCSRGDKGMGYTCGLWQLFHITMFGVVEWNKNNIAGGERTFYSVMYAADVFRDYIEHFFGCEVCRHNFLNEYDSCSFERCTRLIDSPGEFNDWKELPLWLFEFHNGVNQRLMTERADTNGRKVTQHELTAARWPDRKHCPSCWHEDGRFDPDTVYDFLHLYYWPNELIPAETRKALIARTSRRTGGIEEDDVLEEDGVQSWVYSLAGFIIASTVLSAASWVQKKAEIKRTGKHKKDEDDFPDDRV